MNNAVESITKSLETFFVEQDAQIAASDLEWALGRRAALRAFQNTEECADLWKKGAWGGIYDRLFAICGGKTWYSLFNGSGKPQIEAFMAKNSANVAKARNAKIVAKLIKSGVESVESAEVAYCRDGFNGFFRINGDRIVTINSIIAGGHNIQRLHQRVLVTVK